MSSEKRHTTVDGVHVTLFIDPDGVSLQLRQERVSGDRVIETELSDEDRKWLRHHLFMGVDIRKCSVCQESILNGVDYMVKNEIWKVAGFKLKGDVAHIHCLSNMLVEKRGFPIRYDDLSDAPVNDELKWILECDFYIDE